MKPGTPEWIERDRLIAQEYTAGWTMGQIAERLAMDATSVRRSLKRTGTPPRRRGYPAFRLDGLSYWQRYYAKVKADPERKEKYHASIRRKKLRASFGITVEEYEKLLTLQGGKCAVCSVGMNYEQKRLCVDHCHRTGVIRGLLCDRCNHTIGHARDDVSVLQRCIEYLKAPPALALNSHLPQDYCI